MLGGFSLRDNEPVDVIIPGGKLGIAHGIELKTMVSNKANKLTMKRDAMDRKRAWERKWKAPVHTIVFDDHAVFNAKGKGNHDPTKRRIFYRRGYGSMRVGGMYEVKSEKELIELLNMPKRSLPKGAK